MKSWKDNIFFVLVEPKESGNIGASARAMKNMGFKNLELVKPKNFSAQENTWMACNAVDILKKAKIYPTIPEAVKGKNIIVGTTRRIGRRRGLIIPLNACTKRISSLAAKNKIAILFGREDKGLKNSEIEECGFLITIPSDPLSPSINLAQSVLLVAYELSRDTYSSDSPELVKHGELRSLYKHIQSTLKLLEYIPKGNRDLQTRIMRNLKHLIGRSGLTDWELRMLHGICAQTEKKLSK